MISGNNHNIKHAFLRCRLGWKVQEGRTSCSNTMEHLLAERWDYLKKDMFSRFPSTIGPNLVE